MIGTGSGTARRRTLACLTTAGLLIATAACGAGAPGTVRATATPGGGALTVLSASFVSASAGWLLATPCADQIQTCRTVVARKTVDGGRTWSAVNAPDVVGTILFASTRVGWAFGPALWQTRDGGLTWQKMRGPDGQVQDLSVAADRVLVITSSRCRDGGLACTFRVYSAPEGSDDWRAVPGATAARARWVRLAASGDAAYMFAIAGDLGQPVLLGGPVNGSVPWRSAPDPCRAAWSGALAAAGGWLFLGCGLEPGAGTQIKTAYLSDDGARSWRKLAGPPVGGYLEGASMSPAGTIFLSGGRMDVYISWDRGRSWHESPSLADAADLAGAGFPLAGMSVSGTWGFAVQEGVHAQQVWLSRDGGRHWAPVTIR